MLHWLVRVYTFVVIARVIVDWLTMFRSSWRFGAIPNLRWRVTEPALAPIRRALDRYQRRSGIDFSPLVLILLLGIVQQLLWRIMVGR